MQFDFAAILVALTVLTGVIWGLDRLFFAKRRAESTPPGEAPKEPIAVEYARSFFPVILVVLLFRSFLAEPFRIPSGSMMPTLLVGDFILVNKFAYGLRLPVLDKKVVDIGEPKRGDVVVFRYPKDPSQDYIKRVIGLPGDEITYRNKKLLINGKEVPTSLLQLYADVPENRWDGRTLDGLSDADRDDMRLVRSRAEVRQEMLPEIEHRVIQMPGYPGLEGSWVVPEGHYFAMGDNRDNSADSRAWGFVPEQNLVGRAFVIWMSIRDLRRIGTLIK